MKFQLPKTKSIFSIATGIAFVVLLRHIEVDSLALKSVIDCILWLSIPGFLYKFMEGQTSVYRDMLMIVIFGIYILATCFLGLRFVLCADRNVNVEYVSKHNKSVVVIRRGFVCMGTEDDYYLVKCRDLTGRIMWITAFNENPVDTSLWQKF